MVTATAADPGRIDYVEELPGRSQRSATARFADGAGQSACASQVAKLAKDARELVDGCGAQKVGGGGRSLLVHAHVEWLPVGGVLGEAESPSGLVELMRGNAEVEENGVDLGDPDFHQDPTQIAERSVDQLDAISKGSKSLLGGLESGGVQVQGDQAPIGPDALEDCRRVLASPHRAVDHHGVGPECQKGKGLIQEYGPV